MNGLNKFIILFIIIVNISHISGCLRENEEPNHDHPRIGSFFEYNYELYPLKITVNSYNQNISIIISWINKLNETLVFHRSQDPIDTGFEYRFLTTNYTYQYISSSTFYMLVDDFGVELDPGESINQSIEIPLSEFFCIEPFENTSFKISTENPVDGSLYLHSIYGMRVNSTEILLSKIDMNG